MDTSTTKRENKSLKRRFSVYTEKKSQCIEWIGDRLKYGYGRIWFRGKTRLAHRIAYLYFKGEFDESKYVCHSCDNPACVNPKHLFLGDAKLNMQDKVRKGRLRNQWSKKV